jgi:hypothetical protein
MSKGIDKIKATRPIIERNNRIMDATKKGDLKK